ncbi:hypothetical protein R5R35_011694 [Gryllus longicercus]|uniref:CCHC-type domain-containing protein n=1 Tax=Gryllus longicercus TaxID=2509291 RepID=A0AAN9VKW0_9ORTH
MEGDDEGWLKPPEQKKKEAREEKRKEKVKTDQNRPRNKTLNRAIKITAKEGKTYADILTEMKRAVYPKDHNTIVKKIRTQKQDLLIVLGKEGNTSSFNNALVKAAGESATLIPKTLVEIRDIDETVSANEVAAAIGRVLDTPTEQISNYCRLHTGFASTQTATVLLPTDLASQLLKNDKSKIKIGWVNRQIREKQQVTRCFKSLDFGHISTKCPGPDRRNTCYKCGQTGHQIKDCQQDTQMCHMQG